MEAKTPKRRAPERSQAQTMEPMDIMDSVPSTPKPKKKQPIKRKLEETKNCEYKITSGGGIVYMLRQKGVTVYDKETDSVRELRFCPNENSVWADEQGPNARRSPVIFRESRLFVPASQPNLRKFLELHPMNVENGGSEFVLVDKKISAEKELNQEFLINDAITLVRDKDITELLAVSLFFKVNINAPTSEIRHNLLRIAKSKPQEFIDSFDSPTVQTRAVLKQAADYQIISIKPDAVRWFDANTMIVSVPVGKDPTDVMTRFCLTEKGAAVLADIESSLERLA